MSNLVVAITGASGSVYAVRLLDVLLASGSDVHVTISPAAVQVFRQELDLNVDVQRFDATQLGLPLDEANFKNSSFARLFSLPGSGQPQRPIVPRGKAGDAPGRLIYHHFQDYSAGIASGSFLTAGMVICPCSMGTLASLANGQSSNLIHRAADVHLKERRKLIVVPRETPLGSIQLANMKRLSDAGAVVLPAMPGFYHRPAGIRDLVDFVVGRICDQLGIGHDLFRRWGGE